MQTLDRISVTGKKWRIADHNERVVSALIQKFDVPEIVARILSIRGIEFDDVENFLKPTIKNSMPDPYEMLDMEIAAKRIVTAVINKQKIFIYGDYDVDGATASSLLKKFFAMLHIDAGIYIPDRISEGYGPNTEAFLSLKKKGAELVITVDCGTVSHEPIAAAKNAGLDIIVIDHHLSAENLPDAIAVVNPNRMDDISDFKNLCAAGISFMLAVSVRRELKNLGFFLGRNDADLLSLLDLVALGTICDVMKLTGLNRAFVSQGLKIAAQRKNKGLTMLADIAKLKNAPDVYALGFILGPRINAGGRIGKSDLGARLLSSENTDECFEIALELERLNAERQAIEATMLDEAMKMAEGIPATAPLIFVYKQGWHQGVIGIIASRLKDKYNKPSIVATIDEKGGVKASGRSVTGANLGAAITEARMNDIIEKGGGHAMAAGFTMDSSKLEKLTEFLNEKLFAQVKEYLEGDSLNIDATLSLSALNIDLAKRLEMLGPFGSGNREPRFVIDNVRIIKADIIKEKHIAVIISDSGAFKDKGGLRSMAFRAVGTKLGDFLLNSKDQEISLAGKIKINRNNGYEKLEFTIEDGVVFSF